MRSPDARVQVSFGATHLPRLIRLNHSGDDDLLAQNSNPLSDLLTPRTTAPQPRLFLTRLATPTPVLKAHVDCCCPLPTGADEHDREVCMGAENRRNNVVSCANVFPARDVRALPRRHHLGCRGPSAPVIAYEQALRTGRRLDAALSVSTIQPSIPWLANYVLCCLTSTSPDPPPEPLGVAPMAAVALDAKGCGRQTCASPLHRHVLACRRCC